MTYREQDNEAVAVAELIAERGLDRLDDAVSLLTNEALRFERERYLVVSSFERSRARRGYANSYKPKTPRSRVGPLDLALPQVREGGFYPSVLKKGSAWNKPCGSRWPSCTSPTCRAARSRG